MNKREIQAVTENQAIQLSELADKYGLHNRKSDSLIRSVSLRPDRQKRIGSFLRLNGRKIAERANSGIPFEPAPEDADIGGDIILGHDLFEQKPVGICLNELLRPFVVLGATGSFKTITLLNISAQLIGKGILTIIIDRKGRQFRCLQKAFPGKAMVMRTDGQFPYNPYSIIPGDYQARMVEMKSAIFERKDSKNIFLELLKSGSSKQIPCEHSLHNAMVNLKFRRGFSDMRKLQHSLLAVSTGIVGSDFGNTLKYTKGLDMREVLDKKISLVIESPNSDLAHLEFLVSSLINEFQYHLRNQELKQDELRVVFVIDEGSELFRERPGIPPLIELSTKIRQSGIGLCVGFHAPHLVHSMFRANVHVVCCYKLESGESIGTVKKSHYLSDDEAGYIPKQPGGQGFIILGDRYPKPLAFISLNPILAYDLNIPDEAVEQGNRELMKTLPEIVPWNGVILTVTEQEEAFDPVHEDSEVMTGKEREFLDYVLHRFELPVTEVYREMRLSADEGNKVSFSAINKNLAGSVWLNPSGRKGGLSKFIVPGEKYFAITGKEKPIAGTDGKGAEHSLMLRFALKNIKEMKKCHEVEISRSFQDAVSDIYFTHNSRAYIAEICSSTVKTEAGKLSKIFANSEVSFAFVIVRDRETLEAVENEFKGLEFRSRVIICLLSSFLNSGMEELTNKNQEEQWKI